MERRLTSKDESRLRRAAEERYASCKEVKSAGNRSLIFYFLMVVVIALCIRGFIAEPVMVKGISMVPTLLDGERMLTEKVHYLFTPPARGEIIVCDYPGYTEHCVKRVIALPGETIQIKEGMVFINGEILNESAYWRGPLFEDIGPLTVPEKAVFVMGDNRYESYDSRYPEIGCIPYENIVGRSISILYPFDSIRSLAAPEYPS